MHPFYDASRRLLHDPDDRLLGLASMAAYLTFWALAIPLALRVLSQTLTRPAPERQPDRAEAILGERYAAGEIDDAELRHRPEVLRVHRAPSPAPRRRPR